MTILLLDKAPHPGLMEMTLDDFKLDWKGTFSTSVGLVETYLRRIEEALKNQFATYNLGNTSGSTALKGARTGRDAVVVKLTDAGVIILDGEQTVNIVIENQHPKETTPAPPQRPPNRYGAGWLTGDCLVSAAGVGLVTWVSHAGEAERSNLVGLKPTAGLVSCDLVMLSKRIGSVGHTTRCVKDAAAILSVIAGKCAGDPGTASIPFDTTPDYTRFCIPDGLDGARIGVPRNALRGNPPQAELTPTVSESFERHIELMRRVGATVVDTDFEGFDESLTSKSPAVVKRTDFKLDLAKYLEKLKHNPNDIRTLGDVIRWTHNDPREEYPSRGTEGLENAWASLDDRDSVEFKAALEFMQWLADEGGVRGALERHNLDALILPTCVSPLVPHLGGYPIISVPLGFYPGDTEVKMCPRGDMTERGPNLPFGLSFIGDLYSEEKLIQYAYAFEYHTEARKFGKPIIRPTTELMWNHISSLAHSCTV
ncbi:amidase signature enzyme [Coniochaeta ligniaria NRRL 30616]|uniref:Amidase signature enzyme n=1 Tax=Coniochaeta ligniaria NRRL 30616 TaxID=1408157 RepID=A0A1J7J437_9PEZI|nr:amidase signature enzyme [Coniochaeta ligniaria NRRL 30616]